MGWTQKANYGGAAKYAGFAWGLLDGSFVKSIYIGAGVNWNGASWVGSADVWKYNSQTNSWSQVADYPGVLGIQLMSASNGYYGGADPHVGYAGFGSTGSKVWYAYQPGSNSWVSQTSFPGTSSVVLSFTVNDKIYVIDAIKQTWEYGTFGVWTQKATYPGSGVFTDFFYAWGIGNYGYVGGGGSSYSDCWRFDPTANTWTQMTSSPAGINMSAFFVLYGSGYVLNQGSSILYQYLPGSNSWVTVGTYTGTAFHFPHFAWNSNAGYIGVGRLEPSQAATTAFWQYQPFLDIGVRLSKGGVVQNLLVEPSLGSQLRISKGGTIYSFALTDPSDASASTLRIKIGGVIKAVVKA